ncbi:MAG: DUF4292 domain-containing protein [Bacteroidota bacterium]|nr:DUF4292 domain-containing protein [Bacteroidota bacterium]
MTFPHVVNGNPYDGCPIKAFGHDSLAFSAVFFSFCNIGSALIVAGLSALFLAGCASTRVTTLRETLPMEEVIREVNSRAQTISTLHGEGTVSVETPSFANSASFDVVVKRQPDSVRVVIAGPFGIHLASLLFTPEHFTFYNSIKNEVMEGSLSQEDMPSGNNLPPFVNLFVSPKEILNTLCETRMVETDTAPDSFYISGGSYIFEFRRPPVRARYTVNGADFVVTKIEHFNASGEKEAEERYSYDKRKDGAIVPKAIQLQHEGTDSAVSIAYESVEINAGSAPLTLPIPPDARVVRKHFGGFSQ